MGHYITLYLNLGFSMYGYVRFSSASCDYADDSYDLYREGTIPSYYILYVYNKLKQPVERDRCMLSLFIFGRSIAATNVR